MRLARQPLTFRKGGSKFPFHPPSQEGMCRFPSFPRWPDIRPKCVRRIKARRVIRKLRMSFDSSRKILMSQTVTFVNLLCIFLHLLDPFCATLIKTRRCKARTWMFRVLAIYNPAQQKVNKFYLRRENFCFVLDVALSQYCKQLQLAMGDCLA